ncbi:MAG TPA: Rdx family protein [Chloroflexota bacterium]|nr:Rdx family protein [Chloroflexota bacterium]
MKVKITYCPERGYEPPTLDLARTLMTTFQRELALIELIPGTKGLSTSGPAPSRSTRCTGTGASRTTRRSSGPSISNWRARGRDSLVARSAAEDPVRPA